MQKNKIFEPLNPVKHAFDRHSIDGTTKALREIAQTSLDLAVSRNGSDSISHALSHITMVGALKEDKIFNTLDFHILTDGLRHLIEAGFVLDPDFELDIVNLVYGRDFLEEDTPTDIVFGCHLFDSNRPPPFISLDRYKDRFNRAMATKRNADIPARGEMVFDTYEGSTILSPRTYDKNAWYDRIRKAGAKIVVNDRTELDISRFMGEGYSVISDNNSHDIPSLQYNEYRYVFNDSFILQNYPFLNPFSQLARDIDRSLRRDLCVIDRAWDRRIERPPLIAQL